MSAAALLLWGRSGSTLSCAQRGCGGAHPPPPSASLAAAWLFGSQAAGLRGCRRPSWSACSQPVWLAHGGRELHRRPVLAHLVRASITPTPARARPLDPRDAVVARSSVMLLLRGHAGPAGWAGWLGHCCAGEPPQGDVLMPLGETLSLVRGRLCPQIPPRSRGLALPRGAHQPPSPPLNLPQAEGAHSARGHQAPGDWNEAVEGGLWAPPTRPAVRSAGSASAGAPASCP